MAGAHRSRVWTQLRSMSWIGRSLARDLRFGGILTGVVKTRHRHLGAHNIVNSPYSVLPHIFAGRIHDDDVLVDIGCGKGRVINWWLSQGLRNRMVGIEIDPEIAAATAKRVRRFRNVTIVNGDATTSIPDDATLLYLYSPFDGPAMERFKAMLVQRFRRRGITLLYWNTEYVDAFRDDEDWTITFVPLDHVGDPRIGGTHGQYAVVSLR
jgi:SAM-dependent methyltransferase